MEDTIAQVLTIDESGGQPQGSGDQGGQNQQGGDQQASNQPQAPPQSIEKGMTIDQVVASWGQPQRIVKVETKQIYFYQDAKVTFVNGKVSDVQ